PRPRAARGRETNNPPGCPCFSLSSARLRPRRESLVVSRSFRMKLAFRLAVSAFAFALPLAAQESASRSPRLITIDDFFEIRDVSQPEISPDGQWVAYTVRTRVLKEDKNEQRLWMVPTRGGDPIPMTAEGASSSHARWSPDGKYLSFLSSR